MAKSQRSKREKRLRSIRREIADPFHEKKETAKLAAQAAALAAPKLPVRSQNTSTSMEMSTFNPSTASEISNNLSMDVDMTEGGSTYDPSSKSLKAVGGVGKKMKKKLKIGKGKRRGKGKIRKKHI